MRISLLIIFTLLFRVSTLAQDSLATVYIYRIGTPETGNALPLYLNGTLKGTLNAKSVLNVKCASGLNRFTGSAENGTPFTIEVKPNSTYWLECKLLDQPTFRHVTKEEARGDLKKINKYVAEQVKDDAVDPNTSEVASGLTQSVYNTPSRVYSYKNNPGYFLITAEGVAIVMTSYRYSSEEKTHTRFVHVNDEMFSYVYHREDKRWRYDILDEKGTKLATVMDSGPLDNSIQLTEGPLYDFGKTDGTHWTYSLNGETIVRGAFEWEEGKRTVQIEFLKEVHSPAVFLYCLTYGVQLIAQRASRGAAAAGLFLIR